MTRLTVMLFQDAYPEQIQLEKVPEENGIHLYCYLLNEDKSIHRLLFDGGGFKDESEIEKTINEIMNIKV